jgi:N-6 DNA Methylase
MATLTLNEIRIRAAAFAKDFIDAHRENAESQIFWHEFFQVFGLPKRRVVSFEHNVQKLGNKAGRIDAFWPGTLLVEQKSRGKDLNAAFKQGNDYFHGLSNDELPRYVIVSDFAKIRLVDVEGVQPELEFSLQDLPQHIDRFGFIAGYEPRQQREDVPLNQRAVDTLGDLHDLLKADGFEGHRLEVLLVRLLFCLFADDTGIFNPKGIFEDVVAQSNIDGSDLGSALSRLFGVLNQPLGKRQKSLDERLDAFPYVNGRLFADKQDIPEFSSAMRDKLLACCGIQWGAISPAVFGAMFQKIISLEPGDRRRQMGAHYTSEVNILKLIRPLFLDELDAEFEKVKRNKNQLFEFQKKLRGLVFLDPACGCGNFLVITYRELRRLELRVLEASVVFGNITREVFEQSGVNVDQFYGIEVEDFPAQIAQVAMWLVDHQMNLEAGKFFGDWIKRIPLDKSAEIRYGNALRIEWADFCPPGRLNYILGNPPFIGKQFQTVGQKEDLEFVTKGIKNAGLLDYVSGWYLKAAQYVAGSQIGEASRDRKLFADVKFATESGAAVSTAALAAPKKRPKAQLSAGMDDLFVTFDKQDAASRAKVRCAFVSTNSVTQGEQVGVLWGEMLRMGVHIQFAHRTFQWSNDAPGKAAVHCVIVGFGHDTIKQKYLFEYSEAKGNPSRIDANNINPYLVDAPDIILPARRTTLCHVPEPSYGSFALDDGNLTISATERDEILKENPSAIRFLKLFIGGRELLHNEKRWCLWLEDIQPAELQSLTSVRRRVQAVREWREKSDRAITKKLAATPAMFAEIRQPNTKYLALPTTSSENRVYLPIAFLSADVIASNQIYVVPNATPFHFGVLTSTMHMAWMRYVCGRLKSDFRYSNTIVYNNFPWPSAVNSLPKEPVGRQNKAQAATQTIATEKTNIAAIKLIAKIEAAAQAVLDARSVHQTGKAPSTLAQLYDPTTMPANLAKAHAALDKAVDAAYQADDGQSSYTNDGERVAFLFKRYAALTSLV